ncbi:MAG TPA: hypothetical protein VFX17_04055 [Patescibacteria group bacterium]|nr:hypothetical protein [Patescibacteria group bacterium]
MRTPLTILLAIVLSAYVGFSDLHRTDTAVTVAMLLAASFIVSIMAASKPWLYGIIMGLGLPAMAILRTGGHISEITTGLVAVGVSLLGAYTGWMLKKLFNPPQAS